MLLRSVQRTTVRNIGCDLRGVLSFRPEGSGLFRELQMAASESEMEHGPVGKRVLELLEEEFKPDRIELVNESYKHSVPKGSESHFKVFVVSDAFDGMNMLQRHRAVNKALKEELEGPIHALSIKAKTPSELSSKATTIQSTPGCRGGSLADKS